MAGKGAFNKHSTEVVGGSPANSIATKHGSKGMMTGKFHKAGKAPAHGLTHHHKGGHRPAK